jgi:hypothetical protein
VSCVTATRDATHRFCLLPAVKRKIVARGPL